MTETQRLIDQIERAFSGNAWHGPSLSEALRDVTAAEAACRNVPKAHTIWEIVLHLISDSSMVARRLRGERADLTEDESWPAVLDQTDASWKRAMHELEAKQKELMQQLSVSDEIDLDRPIVANYASIYRTLHGHVSHMIYHAGQIIVLRKAAL